MPSPELSLFAIEVKPERTRVAVALRGELDVAGANEVQAALSELRDAGWDDIVVEPREVTFIDSSGLAVLIAADERAAREGWQFAVADGCAPLERLLALSCMSGRLGRV